MSSINIASLLLIFGFFDITLQFNYLTFDPKTPIEKLRQYERVTPRDKYKEDYELMKEVKKSEKQTACIILVRNNLHIENEDVKEVMKNTQNSKTDAIDFVILSMYKSCFSTIKDFEAQDIFSVEKSNLLHLANRGPSLKFDKEAATNNKHVFSDEDRALLNFIYGRKEEKKNENVKKSSIDNTLDIEDLSPSITPAKIRFISIGFTAGFALFLILAFIRSLILGKKKSNVSDKQIKDKKRR